jgi:hypothetical protein
MRFTIEPSQQEVVALDSVELVEESIAPHPWLDVELLFD